MSEPTDILSRIRVASPCSSSWDKMSGDDRTRYCDECKLHVHDFSAMTRREIERLIAGSDGRICGRLYRRADGRVLTRDCPVGVSAIRRRVARIAGAAFSALLTICAATVGTTLGRDAQLSPPSPETATRTTLIARQQQGTHAEILGTVIDPNGAAVPGANVTLIDKDSGRMIKQVSDSNGRFQFPMLRSGTYTLKVETRYFQAFENDNITIATGETRDVKVAMFFSVEVTEFVGLIGITEPTLDAGPGSTTVFSGDKIRRLPF